MWYIPAAAKIPDIKQIKILRIQFTRIYHSGLTLCVFLYRPGQFLAARDEEMAGDSLESLTLNLQ